MEIKRNTKPKIRLIYNYDTHIYIYIYIYIYFTCIIYLVIHVII